MKAEQGRRFKPYPVYKDSGVEGVALAISFSGLLQVVLLYILWGRRSRSAGQGDVFRFYLKMTLLSLALAPILAAIRYLAAAAVDGTALVDSLAIATLVGAAFAALMLLAGYGLKIAEITELTERARVHSHLVAAFELTAIK
jgi:peptidoglycan biosynthesis protein MviN/MurJ (putative lipid II flippase)